MSGIFRCQSVCDLPRCDSALSQQQSAGGTDASPTCRESLEFLSDRKNKTINKKKTTSLSQSELSSVLFCTPSVHFLRGGGKKKGKEKKNKQL